MSVSHSTEKRPAFQALKIMERKTPPLRYGKPPYWRAPITPASAEAYIPSWHWAFPHDIPDEPITVLDVTSPYLAAMESVKIAHSQLRHVGAFEDLPSSADVAPGYYKVTVPYWAFSGTIVHPLGNAHEVQHDRMLWIAAPTLILLLELEEEGFLGYFKIHDSYVADVATDFRSWANRLRSIWDEYHDRVDMAQNEAAREGARDQISSFKEGYSAALATMVTGEDCYTRRPDWTHAIKAQAASSTWRKAWLWTGCGRPVISMLDHHEISVLSVDLATVLSLPKPPFRFDDAGRKPGALRVKSVIMPGCKSEQRIDLMITIEEPGIPL